MCDYSLCGIRNRLAVEGEELQLHKFSTGSMGLASPMDLMEPPAQKPAEKRFWERIVGFFDAPRHPDQRREIAVCIPPGADLILKDIPLRLQQRYGIEAEEGVKFVQTGLELHTYRDAIRFDNGIVAGLQDLPEGLKVEVLSLARVFADEEEIVSTRGVL